MHTPDQPAIDGDEATPPLIVYLHIPKAAGSSLGKLIFANHGKPATVKLAPRDSLASFHERHEAGAVDGAEILYGHLGFGIHTLLQRPCRYITVLREPVDRVVSLYYYILTVPDHRLYTTITDAKMSLQDFAESGLTIEAENFQTRFLGCDLAYPTMPDAPPVTREDLASAIRRIDDGEIAFAGLTEQFDATVLLLARELGWHTLSVPKQNVTRERPPMQEVSDDAIEAIRSRNALDLELYEHVSARFEAGKHAMALGDRVRLASRQVGRRVAKSLPRRTPGRS